MVAPWFRRVHIVILVSAMHRGSRVSLQVCMIAQPNKKPVTLLTNIRYLPALAELNGGIHAQQRFRPDFTRHEYAKDEWVPWPRPRRMQGLQTPSCASFETRCRRVGIIFGDVLHERRTNFNPPPKVLMLAVD